MKFFLSFLTLIGVVSASPLATSSRSLATKQHDSRDISDLPWGPVKRGPNSRVIMYVQTFHDTDGNALSLLPLLTQDTGITHIILASIHLNETPGDIHLNDDPFNATLFSSIWTEVPILQAHGIKVMGMMGGAGDTSANRLALDFDSYYDPLLETIQQYGLDGLDIDIEVSVDISVPLQLLNQLYTDMGSDFILTLAPVASALAAKNGADLSGFNYFDLDEQAVTSDGTKLVSWYNAQFYSGFGTASTPLYYELIMAQGWDANRVVMGVLDSASDGSGWISIDSLTSTITTLRHLYPRFGGVDGWEYFNAGNTDGFDQPYEWVGNVSSAVFGSTFKFSNVTSSIANLTIADVPYPVSPFSNTSYSELEGLGATHYQALQALNQTNGDVTSAKNLFLASATS